MRAGAGWTESEELVEAWKQILTSRTCSGSFFLFVRFLFCAVQFGDFIAVCYEDDAGTIDEEAVLDDAGDVAKFTGERRRVWNAAEVAVEDVMSFVGDERFSIFLANDYGGAELFDFAADKR